MAIDDLILNENWSDLRQFRNLPEIDIDRMRRYRIARIKSKLKASGAAMCVLVNPVSLRYAIDYHCYALFQSHIPTTYVFVPLDGPIVLYGAYTNLSTVDEVRPGRPLSVFDGGLNLEHSARSFALDVVNYLQEIGTDNRRVAIETVNPGITQALEQQGLEVIDGATIAEDARVIKSPDEIHCIRWSVAVAEHGISMMRRALKPGIRETQLWGLLNYANLANHGHWHEGRMLASGDRINP